MGVRIEVYHEDAGGAVHEFKILAAAWGLTPNGAAPAAQPVAEPEVQQPKKTAKAPKAEKPAEPTPLDKAIEATKAEPVAEKPAPSEAVAVRAAEQAKAEKAADGPVYGEAACRAGLQRLHSVYAAKTDGPTGIKAAQAICVEFGVKKVSDLKADQYQPFVERIDQAIAELGKAAAQ